MGVIRPSVIALALAVAAGTGSAEERPPLLCGGVEPFWSLEINADTAIYSAPDTEQIDYTIPHIAVAEGRAWPQVLTLLAQRNTALAIVRPMACVNAVRYADFTWVIDVLTQRNGEAIALTGCCRLAPTD